jgi:hypothetical protein
MKLRGAPYHSPADLAQGVVHRRAPLTHATHRPRRLIVRQGCVISTAHWWWRVLSQSLLLTALDRLAPLTRSGASLAQYRLPYGLRPPSVAPSEWRSCRLSFYYTACASVLGRLALGTRQTCSDPSLNCDERRWRSARHDVRLMRRVRSGSAAATALASHQQALTHLLTIAVTKLQTRATQWRTRK